MNGSKVLNVVFYGFRKTPYPNLGVAYLVSNLRKHQFNCNFQYLESFEDITIASGEICKMDPDIVGLTAVSADFNKVRILSKKLKGNCKATILLGGSHISSVPQTLPLEIDIGFLGESEETIIDIFTLFKENRCTVENLRKVKGIAFFDKEKKLHINQRRIFPKNLDCFPRPARDLFGREYWKNGLTSLITSRGCPYHCSFCQVTTEWKSCRYHSAEYVVEEIKELVNNYGIHTFGIVDDLFVVNKRRIGKITEKLKEVGLLGKVHFTVNGRANLINRELVEMLKELGTTEIVLGLESMSPRVLPLLKDKVTVEDNKLAVETIYKCGLKTGGLFIIGTPSETKKDLEITYNYVKKNRHKFGGMQVCVTTPLPQTPLWELCVEKGLVNSNIEEFDWDLLNIAAEDIRTNLYVGDIDRDVFIKILPKFRELFFNPDLVDGKNKLELVGKMLRKTFSLKAARLIFTDPFLLCRKFLDYLKLMKDRSGNLFDSESNEECTSNDPIVNAGKQQKLKKVFLDCTHTYESDLNTGIQRVVRNIVNESEQIGEEFGIECQPVIIRQGRFLACDKIDNKHSLRAAFITLLKNAYRKLRPFFRALLPFRNIERFLFPAPGRIGLTTIINIVLDILLLPVELMAYLQKRVIPRQGDLLLLLDSSWVYPIWPAVKRAKKNGAIIGLIVYDIIPITHPHFMTLVLKTRFKQWFDKAIAYSDFIVAISNTSRNETKKFIESRHPSDDWEGKFESFRLGSVIDDIAKSGEVRDELRKVFEDSDKPNTYFTVGTIEPRKNHKYLLDAFDEIWKNCPDVQLCIVGRLGWFYGEFLKRIKSHPKYSKCLFMFNDLSDTELDYCYSHSKALVYPSLAEGFGLPLVEALYKRLPVLASDIPIFREVGKDFCTYFDISKHDSLAKIIVNIEKTGEMPEVQSPQGYNLPTWEDSCRELLTKAVALYEKVSV